jgi:hypothetical protein
MSFAGTRDDEESMSEEAELFEADRDNAKEPKEVQPIDVLHELEKMPTPFSLINLQDKLVGVKKRLELMKIMKSEGSTHPKHTVQELEGYIQILENRIKYAHSKDADGYRSFFTSFDYISADSVNRLLAKYPSLRQGTVATFIPDIPDKAVEDMEAYKEMTKELCGKYPNFSIIAPKKDFQRNDKKRDPILLVQSPLCTQYQLIGAWGPELMLVPELLLGDQDAINGKEE